MRKQGHRYTSLITSADGLGRLGFPAPGLPPTGIFPHFCVKFGLRHAQEPPNKGVEIAEASRFFEALLELCDFAMVKLGQEG